MYKKEGLRDLAKELERQRKTKRDYVVDTRSLHAMNLEGKLRLEVVIGEEKKKQKKEQFALSQFAHEQLADKCGIPRNYYLKMRDGQKYDLLASNINGWIQNRERRMLRTLDGRIRAIVSDRYKCLDNHDVFFLVLKKFKEHDVELLRADLSDRYMYVKGIVHGKTEYVSKQDPLQRGIVISNSEVGAGAFRVEPFLYRLVCENGMIGDFAIRKFHLGQRHDIGQIFSDKTLELEDKALWAKVEDVIDKTFDEQFFAQWVSEMRDANKQEVLKPTKAIDHIVNEYKLPEGAKEDLIDFFTLDKVAGNTMWGLANSVTRYAKARGTYEDQVGYERLGAKILQDEQLATIAVGKK